MANITVLYTYKINTFESIQYHYLSITYTPMNYRFTFLLNLYYRFLTNCECVCMCTVSVVLSKQRSLMKSIFDFTLFSLYILHLKFYFKRWPIRSNSKLPEDNRKLQRLYTSEINTRAYLSTLSDWMTVKRQSLFCISFIDICVIQLCNSCNYYIIQL